MKRIITAALALLIATPLISAEYFVATNGDDKGKGSMKAPFATVERAVKAMSAGDVCYIRGGEYYESVNLDNLNGSSSKRYTFKAYEGEEVLFNGSEPIETKWTKYKGNIYQTKIDFPIWQLFVEGKSMTSARYPNGNWYDDSIWSAFVYPEKSSVKGNFTNAELKSLNFSLEDAMMVVNSASWGTWLSKVTEHESGSDSFKYDESTVKYLAHKPRVADMRYYFEGKLELIDESGEWYFDTKTNMLYLWAPDNADPNKLKISGKTQSFAFEGENCSYVDIQGINFFATTLQFLLSKDVTIEDCDFMFPSYNKRMLRSYDDIDVTSLMPQKIKGKKPHEVPANFKVVNCKFEYLDGTALAAWGKDILIENCLMRVVDFSCIGGDAAGVYLNSASNLIFRHNTFSISGSSATLQLGAPNSIIEYNDISRNGYMQHDGALIQLRVAAADGSIVRYNWLHNTIKTGVRTDNVNKPGMPFGVNCTAHNNVFWECDRGTHFKGDKHFVYNNTSFDNIKRGIIISGDVKINGINKETISRNNLAETLAGHPARPLEVFPVPGIVDHNWVATNKKADIRTQLRDPDNLDFRPRKGAEIIDGGALVDGKDLTFEGSKPDIGAYEYGAKNYWIGGFRDKAASVPIPCDGTKTAKIDADLMWQPAYKSSQSQIYFGESENALKLMSKQQNNIFELDDLTPNKTYYWRVDSTVDGKTIKGTVWSFTTK